MKKNRTINSILFFIIASGFLVSCKKDFLEVIPKGSLIAQKTSDYDMLLNTFGSFNLLNVNTQVPMGDELAAIDPYFTASELRTQRLFNWADTIYERNEDPAEQGLLSLLYSLNIIINEVMDSEGGTAQQKRSIRAEAYASRAWIYFLLINYYGKPYNEATAATDPGFPIIEAADVTREVFERATVKKVYDFIVNDLTTAIQDLPVPVTHRTRMSKGAAEGLLGKVYLFMGRYSEALTQLDAAFTDFSNSSLSVRLYDYNVEFETGGVFLPVSPVRGPSGTTGPNFVENVLFKQFRDRWTSYNNELVLTPQTTALYGATDLRLNFFTSSTYPAGGALPNGFLRKYGKSVVNFGVLVPDLYLLRAEAKARINDLTGATQDVYTLRRNRIRTTDTNGNPITDAEVPPAIAANQEALVRFILEERIREFALEGARWFDMRRLSVDPVYSNTVGTEHVVYSESGTPITSITLNPDRFTLKIPQKIIDQNPGMQNNP